MGCIGQELLAEAKHLQRMTFDAPERGCCAIDQHPFWRLANAQRRRVPQPRAGQLLDLERQFRVLNDVNIDSRNRTANNPNAAIGP